MLEEKERLKEEWRTFEEQRKNFEMERRSFTEAAIRLGHEVSHLGEYFRLDLSRLNTEIAHISIQTSDINIYRLCRQLHLRCIIMGKKLKSKT